MRSTKKTVCLRRRQNRRVGFEWLENRDLLHGEALGLPVSNGLAMRLVAEEGVSTIGSTVSGWDDISGNGNNLVTLTGNPQLVHGELNGRDVVRLGGFDDRLGRNGSLSLPVGNQNRTVFVVSDYESRGWGGFVYGSHAGNRAFGVMNSPLGYYSVYAFHAANNHESGVISDNAGWNVQTVTLDGGNLSHHVNGNLVQQVQHSYNTGADAIRIGGALNDRSFHDMDIAEIIVFNRALSESERLDMEQYFRTTYFTTASQYERELVVGSLAEPIAIETMPDGKLLIAQRRGGIKRVDAAQVPAAVTSVVTLPNLATDGERGLLDITLDPNFSTNGYLYAYYSHAPTNKDRVGRFKMVNGVVSPSSEFLVWEAPRATSADYHHGGSLNFDNAGKLLITTGDEFTQDSQNLDHHLGKVLRLNANGTVPGDNPFVDGAGGKYDPVYAYGLRNAYRARYDTVTGKLFIGDVGANDQDTAVEEVNVLERGANYGWPQCQGSCGSGFTNPVYEYSHSGAGAAIVVGDIYRGNAYPGLSGSLFVGDYVRGTINAVRIGASGQVESVELFASGLGSIVDIRNGPDDKIYYVDITGGLYRFEHDPNGQEPTIQQVTADVSNNVVDFRVISTGAPPRQYSWDFGDGSSSTAANPTHVYSALGTYQVQVVVTNEFGTVASSPISVTIGGSPDAEITIPQSGQTFRAGDTIRYQGAGTDTLGDALDPDQFSWVVRFLHDDHFHPGHGPHDGASGSFVVPSNGHDFTGNTRYRIELTVTDDSGASAKSSVDVFPEKVNLTIDSDATGTTVLIDGIPHATPYVIDTLINFEHVLSAPNLTCGDGSERGFLGWSDGGSQTHSIIAPEANATITARYAACETQVDEKGPKLHRGSVVNVRSSGWTTVTLPYEYDSMVVVTTPRYGTSAPPLVPRIRAASGNSFQVKLDRADNLLGEVSAAIDFVVVEEGVYSHAEHGVKMEAVRRSSTTTHHDRLWSGDEITSELQHTFAQPVLIGQVMTYNDPDWSVFWSRGQGYAGNPANSTQLRIGKHVGEDNDTTRSDETIGYIVIEAGQGTASGIPYHAFQGPKTVDGVNGLGTEYTSNEIVNAVAAVASQSGMAGANGSWVVMEDFIPGVGGQPTRLKLLTDEDAMADAERAHVTEVVHVVVFGEFEGEGPGDPGSGSDNVNPVAIDDQYNYLLETTLQVTAINGVLANDSDADASDTLTASLVSGPSHGTLTLSPNGSFQYTSNGVDLSDQFVYQVSDGNGGTALGTVRLAGQSTDAGDSKLHFGSLANVRTDSWTTVVLPQTYDSMVVVATPQYDKSSVPLVTRIQSAQGNQFQIRLSRTDSLSTAATGKVEFFVIEEGVYTSAEHGMELEALRYESSFTDRSGLWRGDPINRLLQNSYASPVVLGQVMTYNDSRWSTFWTRGDTSHSPATSHEIRVGKHVGEDPVTTRADETLGVVVIEAGRGLLGDRRLIAGVGDQTIRAIVQSGSSYSLSTTGIDGVVGTQAGMQGGQGSWAVLDGNDAVGVSRISFGVDEDQSADAERSHVFERVGYLAIETPPSSAHVDQAFSNFAAWRDIYDTDEHGRKKSQSLTDVSLRWLNH